MFHRIERVSARVTRIPDANIEHQTTFAIVLRQTSKNRALQQPIPEPTMQRAIVSAVTLLKDRRCLWYVRRMLELTIRLCIR